MGKPFSIKTLEVEPLLEVEVSNGQNRGYGDSSKERDLNKKKNAIGQPIIEPTQDSKLGRDEENYLASTLVKYQEILATRASYNLGYPGKCYDYHDNLAPFLRFHINNVEDPFICSNYGIHSREFEIGVLEWFAKLWEIENDEYWGYVTNGGTEGNLHGLLIGRELLPSGILYTSRESHYSVFKVARMLKMECEIIDTLVSGEIDLLDLQAKLLQNKDKPAIVNVNIGTTFKGALDDLDLILHTLQECGFDQDRFYIHCDAALSGLVVSSIKFAQKITFKKAIGSISVSGHKFLGCPMPCGVQITRRNHINVVAENIELIASTDATMSGSRNGHSPIFLWHSLNKKGYIGIQRDVQKCLENAKYLRNRLMDEGISVMLNELSITVVLERHESEEFVKLF